MNSIAMLITDALDDIPVNPARIITDDIPIIRENTTILKINYLKYNLKENIKIEESCLPLISTPIYPIKI